MVAISDVLGLVVDEVFPNYRSYGGPMLILAAIFYTFQLYFNFSGYSEVARAVGLLLGLNLPENFKTPFFATNFSGFWSRWHISFSSWLQDYLFMPLAWADVSGLTGGRIQRLPAEFCVFTVFFVSGFWHGNTLPFVIWGLLQACYRLGEELMHRRFGKPKKKAPAKTLWAKRAGVFVLWTISMVFFCVGMSGAGLTAGDAFAYLGGWFTGWSPARFVAELYGAAYNGFYANTIMVAAYDTAEQKVGVVSIPRDTLVDRSFPKINAVYGSGGIEALKETVSDLIGIPIDHYMTVNIRAFKALVDAVGGIDFYVPCDMDYDDSTPGQELYIHYKEGMQHLNGQQALEVVRFRHNNDGSGYTSRRCSPPLQKKSSPGPA